MGLSFCKSGALLLVLTTGAAVVAAPAGPPRPVKWAGPPQPVYYRLGPLLRQQGQFMYVGKAGAVSKYDRVVIDGHLELTAENLKWSTPLNGKVTILTTGFDYVAAATGTDLYLLDGPTGKQLGKAPLGTNVPLRSLVMFRQGGQEMIRGITTQGTRIEFSARELAEGAPPSGFTPHE
jgi:hypothetical protein